MTPEGGIENSYVYLYRERASRAARYVGYGASPDRAMQHATSSHNERLKDWLEAARYTLEVAGPYATREEGLHVEAALISALTPSFNKSPGTGPKFAPMGVPPELADRITLPPLTLEELALAAEGALVVMLSSGRVTSDGRIKADPANPDVFAIAENAEASWQVDRHMDLWSLDSSERPHTLIAVHGPNPRTRFVLGSFAIDVDKLTRTSASPDGSLWMIPLLDRNDADARQLRGRKLTECKFGQGRHNHYKWLSAEGSIRYPEA